jgi:hypothetical protein
MPHIIRDSRAVALMTVLVSLTLAIQLTPRPPNVEFTSLFTFTFGFLFGSFTGILFGSFIMFVNGFFSPWGFAGLNMPFQIVGMAVAGLFGSIYRGYVRKPYSHKLCGEVAVFGAVLALLYDLITNLGVALSYMIIGMPPTLAVVTAIAFGTPFSLLHVGSNIAVFGIIFFPLTKALNHTPLVKNLG